MVGYLLLATACDGSLATTAQFTSIRVVCNNTLAIALSGGKNVVKVPHSTTFEPDRVKQELGFSTPAWDDFRYRMKKLAERKLGEHDVEAYLRSLFSAPAYDASKLYMDRTMRQVQRLGAKREKLLFSFIPIFETPEFSSGGAYE